MLKVRPATDSDINRLSFLIQSLLRMNGLNNAIDQLQAIATGSIKTNNQRLIAASEGMKLFVLVHGHEAFNQVCEDLLCEDEFKEAVE